MSWPGGMVAAKTHMAALAVLALGAVPAVASDWAEAPDDGVAIMLPADGRFYPGRLEWGERDARLAGRGGRLIYMAHVRPGRAYTLGVRLRGNGKARLEARLYDRWPGDPEAKSWRLKTGPRLMTNPRFVEYDWRLSVDKKSPGSLMYLALALKRDGNLAHRHRDGVSVRAFLVSPPIEPMRERGRGVTYLRGPEQIRLVERGERVRIVQVFDAADSWRGPDGGNAGRIPNGDFADGLSHWQVFPAPRGGDEPGVAVGAHGLRLWALRQNRVAGVEQHLVPPLAVRAGERLVLRLRVNRQAQRDGFASLDDFPLRVDVACAGTRHGQARRMSRAFSLVAPKDRSLAARVDVVPEREWARREIPLPAGCRMQSLRLSGGGLPERETVVRWIQIRGEGSGS